MLFLWRKNFLLSLIEFTMAMERNLWTCLWGSFQINLFLKTCRICSLSVLKTKNKMKWTPAFTLLHSQCNVTRLQMFLPPSFTSMIVSILGPWTKTNLVFHGLLFQVFFFKDFFLFMSVFPTYMYVNQGCCWCLWTLEEGSISSGTGVTNDCVPHSWWSERAASVLWWTIFPVFLSGILF